MDTALGGTYKDGVKREDAQERESGAPKEKIRGVVLRITYENKENDYRVVKLEPLDDVEPSRLDKRRELVLVGSLPGLEVGETIEAEGRWASHPQHGPQFKADWFKPTLPSGVRGIEAYLGSGAIRGVGKVFAQRIVAKFGEATFEILDGDIEQLRKVRGVSEKKLEDIRESWKTARGDRALVTFLGEHGITPVWASRLRRAYGEAALSIVRANPYRLAAEVRGVGFHRADVMARRIGLAADAPERIDAALAHVLEDQAGEGHTFVEREALLEQSCKLLDLDLLQVETRLKAMLEEGRLSRKDVRGVDAIFLNPLLEAEKEIAESLICLKSAKRRLPMIDLETNLRKIERGANFELSDAQRAAVLSAAREGMMVLTGGPGTGKTTTLRSAIRLFQMGDRAVRLAAPTGRAARRLAETSKCPAETIHRLLGFNAHSGRFAHDEKDPIPADLVVLDETSMLDVLLARDLLRALSPGTCLILVGDEDQLPSVGPGNVLKDVIASKIIPVARLTEVFRQAQSSLIVVNAHRINRGEAPILQADERMEKPDFFFIERREPAEIIETIKTLVAERIPRKYGMDPIRDVQVLTPMRRGELGVHEINRALQEAVNPAKNASKTLTLDSGEFGESGQTERAALRTGDRVMQMSNNYDKEVFNGDVGWVKSADAESGAALVQFEGRVISYLADELRELRLAYAATIHKSQGSEYRAVIIPVHTQHYIMLKRNLIYTALTRGRELVCIVGTKQALWKAVRDQSVGNRNSALGFFLTS